jgi:prevent-host-death family protein
MKVPIPFYYAACLLIGRTAIGFRVLVSPSRKEGPLALSTSMAVRRAKWGILYKDLKNVLKLVLIMVRFRTQEVLMETAMKLSEDIVGLTSLKTNPGKIMKRLEQTGRPILVTSHSSGVAVMQTVHAYEYRIEEADLLRAIVKGLISMEEGDTVTLADAKKHFGLA